MEAPFYRRPSGIFESIGGPWQVYRYRPMPCTPAGDLVGAFPTMAEARRGYANVPGFEDACAAWDAAVRAAMKYIHEAPMRELHDKVYSLWVGPPMANVGDVEGS